MKTNRYYTNIGDKLELITCGKDVFCYIFLNGREFNLLVLDKNIGDNL